MVDISGPQHWMEEIWAELRQLKANVTLHDRVDDIREAYRDCDIVVCPSQLESFGRVAAEAVMNGIPVVATDIPALRSIVDGAGLLVPVGDLKALTMAVRSLARDSALRRTLGVCGRAKAAQFEPRMVAERMLTLYLSTAKGV